MQVDDRLGMRLGRYRLLSQLGRGGMGTVYLAEHEALGSLWVAKLLHREYAGDPHHVERFLHEARAVAVLRHPNIVQVVDVDCTDSTPYFVMEHLEGEDLQAMLRRNGPLAWRTARDIVLQICSAMHAAHYRGIVHRDLKPANLFCVAQGPGPVLIKVLDFGIAKVLADDPDVLTRPGVAMGTPVYMAPERLQGADATPRSDIYALGVVLYQLLTNRVPFHGTGAALLTDVLFGAPPDIHKVALAGVPVRLVDIVAAAMHRDPAQRIASMTEFADMLTTVTDERDNDRLATRSLATPRRAHPWARAALGLGATTLAVMFAGLTASQAFDQASSVAVVEPVRAADTPAPAPPRPEIPPAVEPARDCAQTVDDALKSFSQRELATCGRNHRMKRGEVIDVQLYLDAAGDTRRVRLSPSYFDDDPFGQCVRRALSVREYTACAGTPRTLSHRLVYGRKGA